MCIKTFNVCGIFFFQKEQHPECFISYCWSNSHEAIKLGSRRIHGALGPPSSDPRQIQKDLEAAGIPCWLDVNKVGEVSKKSGCGHFVENSRVNGKGVRKGDVYKA